MRVNRMGILGLVLGLVAIPGHGAQDSARERLEDRAEIEALVIRYGTALDSLDADGYAAVFAEDAVLDVAGNVRRGRSEIRSIVTDLLESRTASAATGSSAPALYHVISNTAIEIVGPNEARHQSYWQTIRVGPDNEITVGAIGRYEDVLVKQDGRWLIRSRKIRPFTN